ncbi:global transactivator [Fusarium heterosporum]|uniref:Global transactivator n=1 Tax=Fusarium heterosporum TaxID=42747 RepID=A0A8H5TUS0_FUSHE|nr:global transactivator [Fusarium heterosporum]
MAEDRCGQATPSLQISPSRHGFRRCNWAWEIPDCTRGSFGKAQTDASNLRTCPRCISSKLYYAVENRPQALILDTADTNTRTLLGYDVIICASSFLKTRYIELLKQQQFRVSVITHGIHAAKEMFKGYRHNRLSKPLHNERYEDTDKAFSVLIFDEAHDAKNEDSILSEAIRALSYKYAFLVTATPIFNS